MSAGTSLHRRHVGLLWSRDALETEVGETPRVVSAVGRWGEAGTFQ